MLVAALGLSTLLSATPAAADPTLSTSGPSAAVGARPVDPAISNPPNQPFPAAPRAATGCTFPAVTGPVGIVIKHIAPCGSASGTGSSTSPWGTIAQAMAGLRPGEAAYVHDDPNLAVDYRESALRPARDGTAAGRIRLMAAPGERPWIGRSPGGSAASSLIHLDRSWWILDGLNLDGSGLALQASMVRVGNAGATRVHSDVLRRLSSRNAQGPKAVIEFDGAENSALLDSIGASGSGGPVGLLEPLTPTGRPVHVPAAGSGDFADHHAITAKNGADRILIRNNHSSGHNGDSFQCGEEETTARRVTSNITLEGNRFHQDEENAIDLKACQGVTVRDNKMYGYRPARPENADLTVSTRAPQGDAVVAHSAASGRAADRLLMEFNRFWDDSRAVNISSVVHTAVVRRNLVFGSSAASCGMGAGMYVAGRNAEIYHNTLDDLRPPAASPASCGTRFNWGPSERSAIRLAAAASARSVLWNNTVSRATYPYSRTTGLPVDSRRNLFQQAFPGMPPDSVVGDPLYVTSPATNDYYTRQGSPARDAAAAVPVSVADPRPYCDDPSPGETDTLAEADIGFLESCS